MCYVYKDKKTGKWYEDNNFLGTIYTDEITEKNLIELFEECDKSLDEEIKNYQKSLYE